MASIFDNFAKQIATGDQIKDYRHASRLFVDNYYALSPKYDWLFHVFFDLNPEITNLTDPMLTESGMLVKAASLPKFRIDHKVYNNYNRPTIAQSKVRFENLTLSFHDDQTNVVRKLWFDYYNYYYRDMDNSYGDATGSLNPIYQAPNKHTSREGQIAQLNRFGYTPRSINTTTSQYINAIRIYSLHQKRFTEYTLINPVIISYEHGEHNVASTGTLENAMTISYETVLYAGGSASYARGFADLHYDKSPSPLTPAGGGTNSILGPGGIVQSISEVITDGSNQAYGSALFKAIRTFQKNKNVDIKNLAKGELTSILTNVARNANPLNGTFFPTATQSTSTGSRPSDVPFAPESVTPTGTAVSNGSILDTVTGAVSGGIQTAISGVVSTAGALVGSAINSVTTLAKTSTGLQPSGSAAITQNAYPASINNANQQIQVTVNQQNFQNSQENVSTTAAFYRTNQAILTSPVFQTSTNTVVNNVNPLSQTPSAGTIISANDTTAGQIATTKINTPPALSYAGNQATNPIPGTT